MGIFRKRAAEPIPTGRPAPKSPREQTTDEYNAELRSHWPNISPEYLLYMQQRWAPLVSHLATGTPDGDAGIMTSNLAGILILRIAPPNPESAIGPFFDQVVAALGAPVESLRADFEQKCRGNLAALRSR